MDLIKLPSMDELHSVIMSFDVNSAIRRSGFGVGFYQYRWDIIKIDLLNVV